MSSLRILVTGASGFVGRWLVNDLRTRLSETDEIILLGSRLADSPEAARFLQVDITDQPQVERTISEWMPTCVVHLAAISAVPFATKDPRRAWSVNLFGTMNLCEAVLRYAPHARVIFVGTSEVYGGSFKAFGRALDEDARLDPTNPYASSKAAADLLVGQMTRDGLRAIRFRPFNHTGPGQTESFVVPAFAAQIARIEKGLQEPVIRVGNLDAQRDFLDVRDVVQAYTCAIVRDAPIESGAIVNICSGIPRRVGDILESLVALSHVPIRIEVDPTRLRGSDIPVAVGDRSRAQQLFGWQPRIPWNTTLKDTLQYWRRTV